MIGQFLKNAVGMDPGQTELAIRNLKSLLICKNEPGTTHSLGAENIPHQVEMVRKSLHKFINTVKKA